MACIATHLTWVRTPTHIPLSADLLPELSTSMLKSSRTSNTRSSWLRTSCWRPENRGAFESLRSHRDARLDRIVAASLWCLSCCSLIDHVRKACTMRLIIVHLVPPSRWHHRSSSTPSLSAFSSTRPSRPSQARLMCSYPSHCIDHMLLQSHSPSILHSIKVSLYCSRDLGGASVPARVGRFSLGWKNQARWIRAALEAMWRPFHRFEHDLGRGLAEPAVRRYGGCHRRLGLWLS